MTFVTRMSLVFLARYQVVCQRQSDTSKQLGNVTDLVMLNQFPDLRRPNGTWIPLLTWWEDKEVREKEEFQQRLVLEHEHTRLTYEPTQR